MRLDGSTGEPVLAKGTRSTKTEES